MKQKKKIMDQVNRESAINLKKRKRSEYDEEYDKGKVKKVKTLNTDSAPSNGINKFQSIGEKKSRAGRSNWNSKDEKKKGFKHKNRTRANGLLSRCLFAEVVDYRLQIKNRQTTQEQIEDVCISLLSCCCVQCNICLLHHWLLDWKICLLWNARTTKLTSKTQIGPPCYSF